MSGWHKTTLRQLITLQRGHDLPSQERSTGNIPVMGSFGITGYHDEARARGPGVTVGRSGASIGTVSFIDRDYWPLNTCMYVTDFKGNDPRFVYHFLGTLNLARFNSGSAQPSLNRNYIYPMEILVPPISEQREIAATLGALDDKIELNRKTAATLEEMARTLYRSWFVDFDPVRARAEGRAPAHMDPATAALFPDSFGEDGLPVGWEAVSIGSVCDRIFSGGTPKTDNPEFWGGDLPWLSSGETRQPFIIDTENTITKLGVAGSSTRLARAGAIVIASAGQGKTRGQTSYLSFDSYVNQSVIVCEARKELFSDAMLYCDLSPRYDELRGLSDANSSRGSLTTKLVGILKTVKPDQAIVRSFDDLTRSKFSMIELLLRENRTLASLRDTLLPRLMSGELRVGAAREMVEEIA